MLDSIFSYTNYIALSGAVLSLVILIILIVVLVRFSKLKAKYITFMKGSDGKMLEDEITRRFAEIDTLKSNQVTMKKQIESINETLLGTYQKLGVVKYDAFEEMGGKLSFAICMLNDVNDGFIMNSMHSSREGCFTYVKEIIKGQSFVELSSEEKQALERAKSTKDFSGK
ncbi:MAG: DUF4446 family protein [Lachnospiraceae bacterium]|nr:DUF4446 family protein [Lachnospiraceae bacterium]